MAGANAVLCGIIQFAILLAENSEKKSILDVDLLEVVTLKGGTVAPLSLQRSAQWSPSRLSEDLS